MRNKQLNAVAAILYLICAVATVCLIIPVFTKTKYEHSEKLITGILVFLLGFAASKVLCLANKNSAVKIMKITLAFLFSIYVFIVIDYTLISDSFGRSISNIFWEDVETINEYLSQKINLVPLATVRLFINAYKDSNLQTYVVLENIFGNLFVLMPFAVFVPFLFKKINTFWCFLIFISVFVFCIEVLQIVFLTGSADIDDFILNVSGAMVAYFVIKIPAFNQFINKFIFGETNEN